MVIKHSKATKLFAAVLAILMVLAVTPATAFAATRKVTVRSQGYTSTPSVVKKKAATVKLGTSKFTLKGKSGYLCFTAKANKTYTFNFSNLKSGKTKAYSAYANFYKQESKYIFSQKVKTQGGSIFTLYMAIDGNVSPTKTEKVYRNLNSRYGKIRLMKGEKVYVYINTLSKGVTGKLTIK